MGKINYKIKHVGISMENETQAREVRNALEEVFDLEGSHDTPAACWGGDIFEVMKSFKRGAKGHVAMQCEDVEAAMADLASRGMEFDESSIKRDETGRITFVYLKGEWGGFCFHLTI